MTALPPIALALAAQGVAILAVGGAVWFSVRWLSFQPDPFLLVWAVGGLAALLAASWKLPRWWVPLQLLFVPALYGALQLAVPSWVYLAAFAISFLVLNNSVGDRVPLYLSSDAVWEAVAGRFPQTPGLRFVDLGSGLGGGVHWLASRFPEGQFTGIESSPLPWLISRWRLRGLDNARIEYGNIWDYSLDECDVVYAFLSPAPMPRLWEKARREMRPGTLLISNSFIVPGVEPDECIQLNDRRRSRLYLWRM